MRTKQEVELVLELVAQGRNDCAIARVTGIPRPTVRDWRRGRVPNFERRGGWGVAFEPGSDPEIPPEAHPAYSYLLGMYLGDGCLSRAPRDVYRLRITLDGIYPNIVAECVRAIEAIVPNRVGVQQTASRAVEVHAHSKRWPQFFPQHGPGPKHTRRIRLVPWQQRITEEFPEPLIRGLIHSDGCRFMNPAVCPKKTYRYPRYNFSNVSGDIRAIFCDHLDLLDIPYSRMNATNISVARREAVARLDEFVGPKT